MSGTFVSMERIRQAIFPLRGQRVMLDRDSATLYRVPTKALKQAVKRNAGRFPEDFMFVLTPLEFRGWRSQFVTSKADRMGLRHAPMAFTEEGVAMLASVRNSARAIQVDIAIMRAFVQLREFLASHENLARKLAEIEREYDAQVKVVFDAIRLLMARPEKARWSVGFGVQEARPAYQVQRLRGGASRWRKLTGQGVGRRQSGES